MKYKLIKIVYALVLVLVILGIGVIYSPSLVRASLSFPSGGGGSTVGTLTAGTTNTKNPVVYNSQTTTAHGLGATPIFITGYIECLIAEVGYSIGDRIPFTSLDGNGLAGWNISAGATNTDISFGGVLVVIAKGGSAAGGTALTAANWKAVVIPYRLN